MNDQNGIKEQLISNIRGGQAFSPIENVLENIDFEDLGKRPVGLPYSFYKQFAHIRIAKLDILEYCTREDYTAPDWPDEYWLEETEPKSQKAWDRLKSDYFSERDAFSI